MARTMIVLVAIFAVAAAAANCEADSDVPCEAPSSDQNVLIQSKVRVSSLQEDEDEEEPPESEEDVEQEEHEQHEQHEQDDPEEALVEDGEEMKAVEPPPVPPFTVIEESAKGADSTSSVCGAGEEIISTKCLGKSLVQSQAQATARMMMGGCCTAWLVKAATKSQGALMLSTGHCGSKAEARFDFNYVGACPDNKGARIGDSCKGKRLSVESTKDEQAIYELEPCKAADAATPILLDIGRPDMDEGMYILGHPNCRPSLLSHEEVHDTGHHCEVRQIAKWGTGSTRVSYYCDTQGGNSGSPVFSARTGYAFAIHSHGGCSKNQASKNWGGLLENSGVVAAFKKYSIPYVNRKDTNIFKYETFVEEQQCPDHAQNVDLTGKTLDECKKLCVGSLTCVGIEHSQSKNTCSVNYRSKTTASACQGDAKYYKRTHTLTTSLVHVGGPTPAPTPPPTPPPPPGTKACGFESSSKPYCGMWSDAKGDKFDWTRRGGGTPSSNTGPSKANEGKYYLYTEASSPRKVKDNVILEGTTGTLAKNAYLQFDYHMLGGGMGTLKVNAIASGSQKSTVWSQSGNKGDKWETAKVPLDKFDGSKVKLQFEGIMGGWWAGDMAIDAVTLYEGSQGPAPPAPPAPTLAPTTTTTTTMLAPPNSPTPAPTTTTTTTMLAPPNSPTPATTLAPPNSPTPATTMPPAPGPPAPSPSMSDALKKFDQRLGNMEKVVQQILKAVR